MAPDLAKDPSIESRVIDSRATEFVSTVAGFLIFGIVGLAMVWGVQAVYHRISPPATLSLVANLEADAAKGFLLNVSGGVQRSGKPLNGQVRVTVQRLWEGSPQAINVVLSDGKFQLQQDPRLRFASKDERLLISAEAWTTEMPNRPAEDEIYLNSSAVWRYKRSISLASVIFVLVLVAVFFWVFTGKATPLKNRTAIIFSYCIMVMFLAIPLTVTNLALVLAGSEFDRMAQAPVGILVAKAWGAKADDAPQWILNIGGHVKPITRIEKIEKPVEKPVERPLEQPKDKPDQVTVTTSTITPANTPPAPASANPQAGRSPSDPWEVEGGVVVPFFVLVLAVIGGAINMARQVPKFHQQGDRSVFKLTPLKSAAAAVQGKLVAEANAKMTAEGQNAASEENDSQAETTWRKGLMDQYMFLISAPFLAIVTYFLLAWLGVTTVPALVLVSFSVGLITEPVIQRIIDAAQSLITTDSQDDKEPPEKDKAVDTPSPVQPGLANKGSEPAPRAMSPLNPRTD